MTTKDKDANDNNASEDEGNAQYFDWHEAVPVLAEEVVDTEKVVETHPDVENSPKKAILPTGVAAGRVQYVGEINETEQYEYDDGKSIMLTSHEKGRNVYMYAYTEEYSDYMTAKGLSKGDIVNVVGKISINEEDNFTHINIENITKSQPRTRANFLTNTAESVLQRIEQLESIKDNSKTPPQENIQANNEDGTEINAKQMAIDTYNTDLEEMIETAIKALEKADEIVHSISD